MTQANIEDVYAQLNITRILIAALETLGEISVPVVKIVEAQNEDQEVQVDYDESNQTFTFKLKIKE
jgi:hypothetical protein